MKKYLNDVPVGTKVRILTCSIYTNEHLNKEGVVTIRGGEKHVDWRGDGYDYCYASEVEILEEIKSTSQYSIDELKAIKCALDYLKDSAALATNELIDKIQEDIRSKERK